MAHLHHLAQLDEGTAAWNAWRIENPDLRPDLSFAQLERRDLSETALNRSRLIEANLSAATLRGADLDDATLRGANLSQANLQGASLRYTILFDADLSGADLTGCAIYGVSAWNTRLHAAIQAHLALTHPPTSAHSAPEPAITVDHLEAAQLLYLLTLEEQAQADLIDALIGMASGVLVDLSDVPYTGVMFLRRSIPVQPILMEGKVEREVFPLFYHQLLPISRYDTTVSLHHCLAVFLDQLSTATD